MYQLQWKPYRIQGREKSTSNCSKRKFQRHLAEKYKWGKGWFQGWIHQEGRIKANIWGKEANLFGGSKKWHEDVFSSGNQRALNFVFHDPTPDFHKVTRRHVGMEAVTNQRVTFISVRLWLRTRRKCLSERSWPGREIVSLDKHLPPTQDQSRHPWVLPPFPQEDCARVSGLPVMREKTRQRIQRQCIRETE